jgi:hypothetical protein
MTTLKEIQLQHDEVLAHLERLESLVRGSAPGSPFVFDQELGALLAVLRQHFAAEEEGGYMSEALRNRPDLGAQAERIRAQHQQILLALEAAVAASARATATTILEQTVVGLIQSLRDHESAERRLVEDAILQDLGVGD